MKAGKAGADRRAIRAERAAKKFVLSPGFARRFRVMRWAGVQRGRVRNYLAFMGTDLLPFEPSGEKADALIQWLGSPDVTLRDVAEMHEVSVEALALWMTRPEVVGRLRRIESAATRRTRLIAANYLPAVANMLHAMIINHESREHSSEQLRESARETAKSAAALLMRLAKEAGGPEECEVVAEARSPGVRVAERLMLAPGETSGERTGGWAESGSVPGVLRLPVGRMSARGTTRGLEKGMITIDGSQGEGGGQILRSALALSMLTGKAFCIEKIRAGRAKPGLMRQHLTCVLAAAQICGGSVEGGAIGSRELSFAPGPVCAGDYHFPIGTAGSTTMVLQAILPALLAADSPSRIVVEGGTHNGMAPPFEFFERVLVPLINRTGARVTARLERPGFYPAGGGKIVVEVSPTRTPRELVLLERGDEVARGVKVLVSKIPRHVGEREVRRASARLGVSPESGIIEEATSPVGPGNVVLVELSFAEVTEVVSSLGEVGKSAERVADEATEEARAYLAHGAPVGEHLADQLMVPLAALGGGRYRTTTLTPHSTTNMETIGAFGGEVACDAAGVVSVGALAGRGDCGAGPMGNPRPQLR